jgi:hypothetical protein
MRDEDLPISESWTPLEIAKLLAVVIVGAPLLAVLGLLAVWYGGF